MPVPVDILFRVKNDFSRTDVDETVRMLEGYRGPDRARILRCVIHLSDGTLERLRHRLPAAEIDYRDVILLAEYDSDNRRVHDFTQAFSRGIN